jgi:Secretion system C-terminal sorting domain
MKKLFLTFTLLLIISNLVQAQSIRISPIVGNVCKGRTFSVPFATTGTFETGNAYKVQIKPFNGTWTDLVSSESKNDILATVPETYGENDINSLYIIRVIASKPSVTSNEINLNGLFSKPNIELLQSVQNAVNPNGAVGIRISGKGSFPMNITLDDSTNITVNSLLINDGSFIIPEKSRDYFIVRVTNICGQGEAKGKLSVTLNEAAVKYFLTQNESYCLGQKIKLAYSSTKKFSNTTKVKIELRKFGSSVVSNEIDAVESNGMIEAIIPDNVPVGEFYEVRVITNSPQSVSTWLNGIVVGERPSLEFDNPPVSVDWNNTFPLKFNYKGIGPWNVTLSDGTSFVFQGAASRPNSQSSFTWTIKPDKTQQYSIASFSTGCGLVGSGKNTVAVTVNPAVRIDSLKKGLSICLGQSFTAKYSTYGNLNPSSLSAVINTDRINFPQRFLKVPAKFENGIVRIELPSNLFDGVNLFTGNFYVGIIYGDNKVTFSDYPITIKSLPTASLAKISPVTLQTKGNVFLPLNLKGIAPITITMTDSTVFNVRGVSFTNYIAQVSNISTQIVQNTNFRLKSVSNDCGTVNIDDTTTVTYTVRNIPANEITIQNNYYRVCAGEKIKVGFKTINPLSNTNEFRVELMFNNSLVSIVGRGKTSPIEIVIPDNIANVDDQYRIRVVSSEGNLISPLVPVAIYMKQIVRINSGSAGSSFPKDFLPNETVSFFIAQEKFSTSLDNFTFSDGETTRQTSITKSFNASTTFSLISVNNLCGEGTVRANSFKINIVPYRIAIKVSGGIACKNKQLNIQYQTQGQTPVDLKYNLQIASTKDSVFRNILENTNQNPLELAIPTTLQSGEYFIRLVSNESNSQSSNWIKIAVRDTPSVNITSNDNKNSIEFDRNKTTILKYNVSNTFDGFFNALVKGLDVNGKTTWIQNFSGNQTSEVYPRNTTTYTLLSAENTCGYGTVTGDVKVSMKPSLILINNFPTSSICTDREVLFNYNSIGEFDKSNVFKFTLVSFQGKRYEVGQTNVGTGSIKVRIPTSVPASAYKVEIASTNPALIDTSTAYLYVTTVPNVVLSGNTIVNAGQTAYLSLNNNNHNIYNSDAINYVFSTDEKGSFANSSGKRYFAPVNPKSTTTYTLKSVENLCGVGQATGSAKITVNPPSDKSILAEFSLRFDAPPLCAGGAYFVNFTTKGNFSTSNKFVTQISDKNGDNFKDIVTEGNQTPLKFTLPSDLPDGDNYRIRVIGTDADATSGASNFPFFISQMPTVSIDSSNYLLAGGKPITIKFNLTGKPAWNLKFGIDESSATTYKDITASPFLLNLNPKETATYKIFSINDAFCPGKVIGTNTVRLELITANEELSDLEVKLFPNPTSDKITIQSDNFKNTTLQIFDNLGRQILQQNLTKSETVLDISNFQTGQYLLQIEREGKRNVYKIMKL